jgi:hypothetical protein
MSDLLAIVWAAGQNEGIDARLLPKEQHKSVQNVRFRKDGRPQKRAALGQLTFSGAGNSQFVNCGFAPDSDRVLITGGAVNVYNPVSASFVVPDQAGGSGVNMSYWGPGQRLPAFRSFSDPMTNPTVAYLGGVYFTAASINAQNAGNQVFCQLRNASGGKITKTKTVDGPADYPRLLTANGIVYCFYLSANVGTASNLLVRTISTTGTVSAATTIGTVPINCGAFDVCAHGSAEFLVIWQSSLTQLSVQRWNATSTPTSVAAAQTITTNSSAQFPTVNCTSNTSSIFVAWLERTATPSVRCAAYDSTLTTQTGAPFSAASTAGLNDQPGILMTSATTADIYYGGFVSSTGTISRTHFASAGTSTGTATVNNQRLYSKPFNGPNGLTNAADAAYVWTHTPELDAWEDQRTTYLLQFSSLLNRINRHLHVPNSPASNVVTAGVPAGNLHLNDVVDTGSGFFTSGLVQLLPTTTAAAQLFGIDVFTFHSIFESEFYASRDTAAAGQTVQIAGGALAEFNGAVEETGVSSQPVIVSATIAVGGSLTVSSSYLYRAVYEYIDQRGRRHRSATSDPFAATSGAAGNQTLQVTVSTVNAASLAQTTDAGSSFYSLHLYRSLAGQSTYHRVTPNGGASIFGIVPGGANVLYNDGLSDASAGGQEFIYTDGGVLDHTLPPPSTFLALCNNRLWLGGQLDRNTITASKSLVDGEPTQFSAFPAFNVLLPRAVTGIASIDGTVVAFAADAIYLVTGDGPNNQGVGSFNPPTSLPTDVGCVDWRSVVETSLGVFFQGQRGIFLLPRGFNVPVFVGAPVEDTLKTYPVVTSATLVAPTDGSEITVRFTVIDAAMTGPGAVLVYNLRTNGWIVDVLSLPATTIVGPGFSWLGKWAQTTAAQTTGLLNGTYEENTTYAEGAGNSFVPSVLATGDVRPFGVAGYGNFESVLVMGEYRGNANVVVSVSVDGVTADTYTFAVTSADAADGVVYLDVTPKIRKGASLAVTVQDAAIGGVATEGFIAQAVYIEVEPMKSGKRLPAARRA